MADLKDMVISAFDKIQADGTIERMLETRVVKTVQDIFDDIFREYSDFGKTLKKVVEDSIKLNVSELSLPEYNQLILNAIQTKLSEVMHDEGVKKVEEDIVKLLTPERKDWKLSEFVEELKTEFSDDARENEWEEISLHVDDHYSSLIFLRIDPEPNKKDYECEISITVNKEGTLNSVEYGRHKFHKGIITDKLRGTEKLLFKLFAQKCKFIVDEDEVDKEYSQEYED